MARVSGNENEPSAADGDRTIPPDDAVEIGRFYLLVDAGSVIGPLADEMLVWVRGRPVWLKSGGPPDLEDVRIWVRAGDAVRGRVLLAALARPWDQKRFERRTMMAPLPQRDTATREVVAALLALVALVTLLARQCGG